MTVHALGEGTTTYPIRPTGPDMVILTVTAEGRLILGPDVTWDEAAEFLLDALERQIGRRIVAVERATGPIGEEVKR